MRPVLAFTTVILLAAAPVFAQTAPAPVTTPPSATTAPAAGPTPALLDSLVSKTRILGITKTSGRRYLCRLTSGDHGVYMAQTFHFAGPPKVSKETTAPTQAAPRERTRFRTLGSGRNRIRVPVTTEQPGRVTKGRPVTIKTPTTIPDADAVKMLLAGVAGTLKHPGEVPDTLTPADITCVQELAPPAKSDKSAAPATVPANAWTLTTLWPLAKDAPPLKRLRSKSAPGGAARCPQNNFRNRLTKTASGFILFS